MMPGYSGRLHIPVPVSSVRKVEDYITVSYAAPVGGLPCGVAYERLLMRKTLFYALLSLLVHSTGCVINLI